MADDLGGIKISIGADQQEFEASAQKFAEVFLRTVQQGAARQVGAASDGDGSNAVVGGAVGARLASGAPMLKAFAPAAIAVGALALSAAAAVKGLDKISDFSADLNRRFGGISGPFANLAAQQEFRQIQRDMLSASILARPAAELAGPVEDLRDLAQAVRTIAELAALLSANAAIDSLTGVAANVQNMLIAMRGQNVVVDGILKLMKEFGGADKIDMNALILDDLATASGRRPIAPNRIPTDSQVLP